MTQEPTTETKTLEAGRATPKCSLRWTVDPATGKPVARWTVERPETVKSLALPVAA
jgi:hypothetical protein